MEKQNKINEKAGISYLLFMHTGIQMKKVSKQTDARRASRED